jgi:TPR repeat protein
MFSSLNFLASRTRHKFCRAALVILSIALLNVNPVAATTTPPDDGTNPQLPLMSVYVRSLAEHSIPDAQYLLGTLYLAGRGVQQDYHEAALWFQKAADGGNRNANYFLGKIYEDGLGLIRPSLSTPSTLLRIWGLQVRALPGAPTKSGS